MAQLQLPKFGLVHRNLFNTNMGPRRTRRNKKKKLIESSCAQCDEPDEGQMVLCDWCENWYHFSCVNLKGAPKSKLWKCPNCKQSDRQSKNRQNSPIIQSASTDYQKLHESVPVINENQGAVKKDPERPTKNLEDCTTPIYSGRINSTSVICSSTSFGSNRKARIELQKIEEEKILQQKRQMENYRLEQDYLEKKYEILLKENERSAWESSLKRTSTEDWVKKHTMNTVDNVEDPKMKDYFDIDDFCRRLEALKATPSASELPPRSRESNIDIPRLSIPEPKCPLEHSLEQQDKQFELNSTKFNKYWTNDIKDSIKLTPIEKNQPKINVIRKPIEQLDDDNWNVPLASGCNLTRAQISARQVVTKDLPIFNGKPEDWPIFYKRYVNSTELCGYSDGENLDRLQKCLRDPARSAVRDLLLDVDAVKDIISTLEMLFGRPELIVKKLLEQIRQLPHPKADNLSSIVSFALDVRNLAKTVERKGLNQYLSNPMLLQELVNRLPTIYKVDWAKHIMNVPDNRVTLIMLSDWLQVLMRVLIKVTDYVPKDFDKKHDNKSSKPSSEYLNLHQEETKPSNEYTKKSENFNDAESGCKFCNKSCKAISDCDVFKSFNSSQRWKAVYDNKLCRKCLRRHGGFCRLSKDCGVNQCKYKHHPLLHDNQKHKPYEDKNVTSNKQAVKANISASHISFNTKVILRIIPIKIFGNGIEMDTFAFLDDGSTATLIEEKLADELKLEGIQKNLCLIWSGNIHRREKNSRQVNVTISSIDHPRNQLKIRDVKTVECLGIPPQRLNKEELCKRFPYLQKVPFNGYENGLPGILIGSNNPRIGIPSKVVEGGEVEPIAAKTKIGWTIHGPTSEKDTIKRILMNHQVEECECQHEFDQNMHQTMKDYFSVENFGVQVPSSLNTISKDEEKALNQLKDFTKRIDGRFETGLLWRYEEFELPESYWMAKRRLECLENKKPETIKVIDDTIQDYIKKGYARKLTKEEAADHKRRHWYLPVFTVTYPKKPDKHRMVFDAAAKVKGVSLNSMLLKGPDQLVSLVEILRRYREKLYALCGDIREMFPQVKMRKVDQDCQRFLWRNGDKTRDPDVYVMLVMTFGAACSPSSAHFIKNENALENSKEFPRAAEAIIKSHYMDDMMERENTEEELIQLAKDVKFVHSKAGFEIRNFLSNSKKVMAELGSTNLDGKVINPDKEYEIERVLGMWWNVETDCFTFSLKFLSVTREIISGGKLPTKRELLKLLMSIFDPLGLISHYLIHLKMLIQDVWRSELRWDEIISSNQLIESWKKWLDILPAVETVQIPRLYTPKLTKSPLSIEIHTFVDASENAFGAVSYLRVEDELGVECSLMGSKCRVAPLKYLSTPRKELQGGLLGSRLANSIVDSQTFKVDKKVFWTDSSTLLSWLRSDQRKYHQFVAHRVGEILENTELHEWRWIPSKLNLADDLTKWPKDCIFDKSNRWFTGPSFLRHSEDKWPIQDGLQLGETDEEMRVMYAHNELIVSSFFDSTRFSNWNRMVRAVAYAIRFTKMLKAKVRKESVNWSHLTRDELVQAQNIIYRQAQFEGFPDEMVTLELNKTLYEKNRRQIPNSSALISCSPYLDEFGVLRVRGRIDAARNIPTAMKRPIIMSRQNWITKLLIRYYHKIYHHRNHETVINQVRQKFYVPKLRVALKSVVTNDCQSCINRRAKPEPPEEGNLPAGRMETGFRIFTHTGLDYFGPFYIIQGRSEVKRWVVLFTCLTVRAIHMEVAYSMTTKSCIEAIRNFICLRGHPSEFYSDRGTNLVGTNNERQRNLQEVNLNQLAATYTTPDCNWNFNPPESKHMGGVWERLIRTVKECLYEIMPVRKPSDEMFRSLLMEVLNVVNSRPLTFIPLDHVNDEALTPNHFIFGNSNGQKPPGDFESDGPILWSEWREIQRLTDCFWRRFVEEYIPTITRKTQWFLPVRQLDIGDIVLVVDKKNDRNVYPKARVIERVIGSNNQVRKVRVQLANGSMLWRSAAGLARLDISTDESLAVSPNSQTGGTVAKAH